MVNAVECLNRIDGKSHSDLKPDNLVINEQKQLALIDFGHSQMMGVLSDAFVGTDQYRPPEVLKTRYGAKYNTKTVDIFGIGCCIFTIMFKRFPMLRGPTNADLLYRTVLAGNYEAFISTLNPSEDQYEGCNLIW